MLPNSNQQMAINLARLRQHDDEAHEREIERQEKERILAESNSPEAIQARFIERAQSINARAQTLHPTIDPQTLAEEKRNAELRIIGDQLAERLAPAITAAIAAGFAQIKEHSNGPTN